METNFSLDTFVGTQPFYISEPAIKRLNYSVIKGILQSYVTFKTLPVKNDECGAEPDMRTVC